VKILDYLLIAALAAAFIIALVHSVRNSKNGCCGDCASCSKNYSKK